MPQPSRRRAPPRSFTCPPELWALVVGFAQAHRIQPSAALRLLVSDGLRAERSRRAHEWQVQQSTLVARKMERGDRREVTRETLKAAYESGRRLLLRRRRGRAAG